MKKLVETILNDPVEFQSNSQAKQLIETVNSFSEEELNNFIEEFEQISNKFSDKKRAKELLEFICKEREGQNNSEAKLLLTNLSIKTPLMTGSSCSYLNSPEKQQSERATRWSVSRDDRRRILEQMERHREDQKRRKKQDWCRLTRLKSEFDELWENDLKVGAVKEDALMRMRIDEGIENLKEEKGPESKRPRHAEDRDRDTATNRERDSVQSTKAPTKASIVQTVQIPHTPQAQTPKPVFTQYQYPTRENEECKIVDFDCIEDLLISLNVDRSVSPTLASSANFIINCADDVYRSDFLFYTDLKEFDQPYFLYYGNEDDLCALKHYNFYNDDLGNYARNYSYNDKSKKFYQERAFRHRYISRKLYPLFFNDSTFQRLREELQNLDKNCSEFHFWFTKTIAKKGTIFVSSGSLLRSFSLLLVLSRLVDSTTFDIANSIWSHRKFGPEWTLQEILKIHKGKIDYLTLNKSSKLSIEASRLGIPFE